MQLKKVQSFLTSDNRVFVSRKEAMIHELKLQLRGVIQSSERNHTTYTATQVAEIVVGKQEEIKALLKSFQNSLAGMRSRQKKVDNSAVAI